MSLLSAADLAFMQDTQDEAMPGTVVIERYALTSDGQGGAYEAWTAAGTVMGRIYPQQRGGMAESVGGAQVLSVTDWFGTMPAGTEVYAQDRLLYGGSTWEVLEVNNDEMWITATRCQVEKTNEERRV